MGTLTRPRFIGPPEGGQSAPEVQLIQSLVLFLLVLDVVADDRLVPPHCRNEISSGPKVLPDEPSVALAIERTLLLHQHIHNYSEELARPSQAPLPGLVRLAERQSLNL